MSAQPVSRDHRTTEDSSPVRRFTIIVPAHNEQPVIGRLLSTLPSEAVVVVVPNGCSDGTADIARSFGANVVELEIGSKHRALNRGDEFADSVCLPWPRFYIDADVRVAAEALRTVAAELEKPGVLAAAPLMVVDCSERKRSVRAYYDVWMRLPYVRTGMIGSGLYALSESGRRRFQSFPHLTADDAYVRLQFSPSERKTLRSCTFTVTPPKTLSKIIQIKTRSHFGNEELRQRFPLLWATNEAEHGLPLLRLALDPRRWLAVGVYVYVKLMTRWRVRQRFRHGELNKWERDETSRELEPAINTDQSSAPCTTPTSPS